MAEARRLAFVLSAKTRCAREWVGDSRVQGVALGFAMVRITRSLLAPRLPTLRCVAGVRPPLCCVFYSARIPLTKDVLRAPKKQPFDSSFAMPNVTYRWSHRHPSVVTGVDGPNYLAAHGLSWSRQQANNSTQLPFPSAGAQYTARWSFISAQGWDLVVQ